MNFQWLTYSLLFPLLFSIGQTYWLSEECTLEIATPLRAALEAAFSRIEVASQELNRVHRQFKVNQDVETLANTLFGKIDPQKYPNKFLDIANHLKSLLSMRHEVIAFSIHSKLIEDDVAILCSRNENSFSTVHVADGNGGITESYSDGQYKYRIEKSWVHDCFDNNEIRAFVVPRNPTMKLPTLIQLCYWFYKDLHELPDLTTYAFQMDQQPKRDFSQITDGEKAKISAENRVVADEVKDFVSLLISTLLQKYKKISNTDSSAKEQIYDWKECVKTQDPNNYENITFFVTMVHYIIYSGQRPIGNGGGDMERVPNWVAPTI